MDSRTPKILCVLRSGGDFLPEHASRMYAMVKIWAPRGTSFLCLSDQWIDLDKLGVPALPLQYNWPGWWSKLEALTIPGPALYLDLDVSIVGDLTPLLDVSLGTPFAMARGFWGDEDPNYYNSSVMAWNGDMSIVPDTFASRSGAYIKDYIKVYRARVKWGDQAFISDYCDREICLLYERLPGMILSFKRDVLRGVDWRDARVICSHGKPRPWDPDGADAWLARHVRKD